MKKEFLFIGIDVSKSSLDVAITTDAKIILASGKFSNNPTGFKKIIKFVDRHRQNNQKIHFCMESTGIYCEKLLEYLQSKEEYIVSCVNPFQVRKFADSRLTRTKNDKLDAKIIALYLATMKPMPALKVPKFKLEFKKLVRFLIAKKESKAREKTRLESCNTLFIYQETINTIKYLEKQISKIEKEILDVIKQHPKLKEDYELLISIPGIGDFTAEVLISELLMSEGEYLDAKKQVANAGLDSSQKQSGTSIKGKEKISKRGNSKLRSSLYFPAMNAIQNNPLIKKLYQRLIEGDKEKRIAPKLKKVALVAAMRKLLVIATGVLRNRVPFNPEWAINKQAELTKSKPDSVYLACSVH